MLGDAGVVVLERLLITRAAAWAAEVAGPGGVYVAFEPEGAAPGLERLVGGGAQLFPQAGAGTSERLRNAVTRVAGSRGGRPVLVAWPELPRWRTAHAAGALDDLRAGCDVSVGPVFDGGFYLVALARPVPALLDGPDDAWRGPEAMGRALAAAHDAGLKAGLLRAERGLRREADVRAALADPLLDPELAAVLRGQ